MASTIQVELPHSEVGARLVFTFRCAGVGCVLYVMPGVLPVDADFIDRPAADMYLRHV